MMDNFINLVNYKLYIGIIGRVFCTFDCLYFSFRVLFLEDMEDMPDMSAYQQTITGKQYHDMKPHNQKLYSEMGPGCLRELLTHSQLVAIATIEVQKELINIKLTEEQFKCLQDQEDWVREIIPATNYQNKEIYYRYMTPLEKIIRDLRKKIFPNDYPLIFHIEDLKGTRGSL